MDDDKDTITVSTASSMTAVDKDAWDALAQPEGQPYYPFAAWDFLDIMEVSGSARAETGWGPQHLLLHRGEELVGAMPCYLKAHSRGEFIFDQGWADAYARAGGRYYPKLLCGIPFTPATGPRLLTAEPGAKALLAQAARQVTEELGLSSLHVNFTDGEDLGALLDTGFLHRTGTQYRFEDQGFGDWDGFLTALASRKRKALKKERAAVLADGVEFRWVTGSDITEHHLDAFWRFYQDTGSRKWGTPYLTRTAFSLLAERMGDQLLFIFAEREGREIAGAMNLIGGDTLFGRYWGASEYVPFLHFETCYYQAIDFALAHGLTYVDAGAQGEHKIARGYVPVTTHSAHYLPNQGFADAVARYLEAEQQEVENAVDYLSDFTPFKKS